MAKGNRTRRPRYRKPSRSPHAKVSKHPNSEALADATAGPESEKFRELVESLSEEQLKAIIDRLPAGLVEVAQSLAGGLPESEEELDDETGDVEQEAAEFARLAKLGIDPPKPPSARVRRAGLYPYYPISTADRDGVNERLAAVGALDDSTKTQEYRRLALTMKLLTSRWQLTDTESAQLLNVEESVWASGEWMHRLNPEHAFRILAVNNVLEWMENLLKLELALRWLHQPDRHVVFGGVVPIEELGQRDLARLYTYVLFVKELYAPQEEWRR